MSLSLSGGGASYALTNAGNDVGTLTGNAGAITLADAAADGLTLGRDRHGRHDDRCGEITNTGAIASPKHGDERGAETP